MRGSGRRTGWFGEGATRRRDLPYGEGAPDVRAHDLTQPRQVPAPEQSDQAVPVRVPLATAAVLDRDLPFGICGGLAQQPLFFGCHYRCPLQAVRLRDGRAPNVPTGGAATWVSASRMSAPLSAACAPQRDTEL